MTFPCPVILRDEESAGSREPFSAEITPLWVHSADQVNLARSTPALDLLLAGDGVLDVIALFEVDEFVDVVPARESFEELVLVLIDSSFQVVSDSRIEDG